MIVFQSPLTGVAEPPAINQTFAVGMSSPGGEETGEGELNSEFWIPLLYASVPLLATFHVLPKIRVNSRNSRKSLKPVLTNYNLFKPTIDPSPPTPYFLPVLEFGGHLQTLLAKSRPIGRVN
jgi:hypothetical protein